MPGSAAEISIKQQNAALASHIPDTTGAENMVLRPFHNLFGVMKGTSDGERRGISSGGIHLLLLVAVSLVPG